MANKTTKHRIDNLKQFFAREIATVNKNMHKKFDELTLKLQKFEPSLWRYKTNWRQ